MKPTPRSAQPLSVRRTPPLEEVRRILARYPREGALTRRFAARAPRERRRSRAL